MKSTILLGLPSSFKTEKGFLDIKKDTWNPKDLNNELNKILLLLGRSL